MMVFIVVVVIAMIRSMRRSGVTVELFIGVIVFVGERSCSFCSFAWRERRRNSRVVFLLLILIAIVIAGRFCFLWSLCL